MSDTPLPKREVTYARVIAIAVPVVISNATAPIQGAIDTAIIGNLGDAVYLAAVALGTTAITLMLSLFNFLQFGAGALSAQALGAGDPRRVINVLARGLILGCGIGLLLVVFQLPLLAGAMALFEGSAEAEALAGTYFLIRIWAAPAELGAYAIMGWFSGQEQTRRLFEMQLVVSISNVILNLVFVLGFGMDVAGVALGTLIGAWLGFGYGLWRARQRVVVLLPGWVPERARLLNSEELLKLMRLNRDIFIRTILLIAAFTWMTRLGSLQGDAVLAANGVLYQFFHVTTFALDGFAIAAESLVGQAAGARNRAMLRRAAVMSTIAAFGLAVGFVLVLLALEGPLIRLFTNVEEVRALAHAHYFWAAFLPLVGVAAFQFDGIFVGATEGPAMRNAMIISAAVYFPLSWWALGAYGNHGVWLAIWGFLILRALTLACFYPALERRAGAL